MLFKNTSIHTSSPSCTQHTSRHSPTKLIGLSWLDQWTES